MKKTQASQNCCCQRYLIIVRKRKVKKKLINLDTKKRKTFQSKVKKNLLFKREDKTKQVKNAHFESSQFNSTSLNVTQCQFENVPFLMKKSLLKTISILILSMLSQF